MERLQGGSRSRSCAVELRWAAVLEARGRLVPRAVGVGSSADALLCRPNDVFWPCCAAVAAPRVSAGTSCGTPRRCTAASDRTPARSPRHPGVWRHTRALDQRHTHARCGHRQHTAPVHQLQPYISEAATHVLGAAALGVRHTCHKLGSISVKRSCPPVSKMCSSTLTSVSGMATCFEQNSTPHVI